MAQPINPEALQQLENELAKAEARPDHIEALDILEDINRRGWAGPRHLLKMGNCYMQVRQRQDAKRCWMKAYALDPSFAPAQEALEKHFAGWKKELSQAPPAAPAAHAAGPPAGRASEDEPPPPPPPPSFGVTQAATLSMETVAPVRPEPPPTPRPAPVAAASPVAPPAKREATQPPEPLPDLDSAFETQARGEPVRTRSGPPGVLPGFEVGAKGLSGPEGKVNWRGVMEEATEIASAGAKK